MFRLLLLMRLPTVQMTFIDHLPNTDDSKTANSAVLTYAYMGGGGILRAWNILAWNGEGPGSGWIHGSW
jgi:hypothetical protein